MNSNLMELLAELRKRSATFSLAESCTGGFLSSSVTRFAGVSDVFLGAVVSYANSAKTQILGVSAQSLSEHGAVSEVVASEMCQGAARCFGSTYQISVTGVAGPTGGTSQKPVGMVCFGVSGPNLSKTVTHFFPSTLSREEIQNQASQFAIQFLLSQLQQDLK